MVDILFVVLKMFSGSQTERSRAYGKSILPIEGGETAMGRGRIAWGASRRLLPNPRSLAMPSHHERVC
jgi:hypothetical protein